jgi:hypothetical protein
MFTRKDVGGGGVTTVTVCTSLIHCNHKKSFSVYNQ